MANCGASVPPANMYGGGMAMKKKKKKSMSYNMGGMPMNCLLYTSDAADE